MLRAPWEVSLARLKLAFQSALLPALVFIHPHSHLLPVTYVFTYLHFYHFNVVPLFTTVTL